MSTDKYQVGATVLSKDRVVDARGTITSFKSQKLFWVEWQDGTRSLEHRGTCEVLLNAPVKE